MMDNSVHTDWTSPKFVYKDFAGWSDHTTAFWVYMNYVSPGYLSTLRIPLLAGRNFNRADVVTSSRVAIVNQTFARRFFPNLNPIGRVFLMGVSAKPFEVVGLMEDSKYESVREEAHPTVFLLDNMMSAVNDEGSGTFELRTAIPPSAMISAVRAQLNRVNSAIQPGFHILADQVNDSLVRERLVGLLSAFFGALALLLAVIGLYGTFNYLVTQRHTEFGIRMALGAQTGSILGLVMRDVGTVLAGGLVAGIFGSLASARVVQQLLFGLGPHDAATMLGAALALSAVALVAGYLPARRATKVDPAVALRHE